MEVDLRSQEKSRRALHFFVNDVQQELFFSYLPDSVTFAVWLIIYFIFSFFLYVH